MSDHEPAPPGFLQVMLSVLAAFFGVQSSRNRKRDFSRGRALPFIVVGLLMTAAFVGALILIVRAVMHSAT